MRKQVHTARNIQEERLDGTSVSCDDYMTLLIIGKFCTLNETSGQLTKGTFDWTGLMDCSHDWILQIAQTLADLEGYENTSAAHLAEVIHFLDTPHT